MDIESDTRDPVIVTLLSFKFTAGHVITGDLNVIPYT